MGVQSIHSKSKHNTAALFIRPIISLDFGDGYVFNPLWTNNGTKMTRKKLNSELQGSLENPYDRSGEKSWRCSQCNKGCTTRARTNANDEIINVKYFCHHRDNMFSFEAETRYNINFANAAMTLLQQQREMGMNQNQTPNNFPMLNLPNNNNNSNNQNNSNNDTASLINTLQNINRKNSGQQDNNNNSTNSNNKSDNMNQANSLLAQLNKINNNNNNIKQENQGNENSKDNNSNNNNLFTAELLNNLLNPSSNNNNNNETNNSKDDNNPENKNDNNNVNIQLLQQQLQNSPFSSGGSNLLQQLQGIKNEK